MTIAGNETRRTLARIAGIALMIWGIGWALAWGLAGLGFCGLLFARGLPLAATGALVGGLVMAAIGAGKAMAGWILVKEDRKI